MQKKIQKALNRKRKKIIINFEKKNVKGNHGGGSAKVDKKILNVDILILPKRIRGGG